MDKKANSNFFNTPLLWKAATFILGAVVLIILFLEAYSFEPITVIFMGIFLALTFTFLIASGLLLSFLHFLQKTPTTFRWTFLFSLMALAWTFSFLNWEAFFIVLFFLLIVPTTFAFSLTGLFFNKEPLSLLQKVILSLLFLFSVLMFISMLYVFFRPLPPFKLSPVNSETLLPPPLKTENPALNGPFSFKTFSYGSENSPREDFKKGISLKTSTVDASPFIDNWSGIAGWIRSLYWGFDPSNFPLNGYITLPSGNGPFPLVLLAHGNHDMQTRSDLGYDYLVKNLASHGIAVVTIDENFLNSSWTDLWSPLDENAGRAFLILKHLNQLKDWNHTKESPLYNKIDMDKIGLIGHSRGGEAIALAFLFNDLVRYTEDANVVLDTHFPIKALVAIAPTDGQILPGGNLPKLNNVNFLVLQGSDDNDVTSFMGASQYNRITFEGEDFWFKAAIFIAGANHGQFNRKWGKYDLKFPESLFINTKNLLPPTEQERIAITFISAFLKVTLLNQGEYLPLFQDWRTGREWLPMTTYLNMYEDSNTKYVARFQEEMDPTIASIPGGKLLGENLAIWKQDTVSLNNGEKKLGAVYLGWNNPNARFHLTFPEESFHLKKEDLLIFSLANASPTSEEKINFTIELKDKKGMSSKIPLSRFALSIEPPRNLTILPLFQPSEYTELEFQTYSFPMEVFKEENPDLDIQNLTKINFIFDISPHGEVAMFDVGFRNADRDTHHTR